MIAICKLLLKNKEIFKKKQTNKLVKGIKNFLGNKKTKSKDMVVNDIRIFLSMKKGYYSIEKNI